jgi:hypothetical protein
MSQEQLNLLRFGGRSPTHFSRNCGEGHVAQCRERQPPPF